ncbi:MAG: hypothetical protein IJ584_00150 [Bacteroidales bacterium]|jgi:hypothetical protein|nr:hypothetical protein [Bacteroidales bacterium]MBR1433501.1 hypothetical protein [Bacteroidales bacterium]
MEQNKFLKIGSFLLFLILAAYSCYATEHSLHMLSPNLPEILVWAITIAFYVVASLGSKMIVDSLNQKIYLENRGLHLVGGAVLMFLFWLMISMPTNTHTFFYNEQISDVILSDVQTTQKYLEDIESRKVTLPSYDTLEAKVNTKFEELNAEFNGIGPSGRKGNGQYVMQRMREINNLLGSNIPVDTRLNVYDPAILNNYNTRIHGELEKVKMERYQAPQQAVKEARSVLDDLDVLADTLDTKIQSGKPGEVIVTQTEGVLQKGYSLIKNNRDFVNLSPEDEPVYCAEKISTRTHQLKNVIKVWQDYLGGKYKGKGFFYWIMISLLVDIGAFIFFDLTFRREEF